MVMETKPDPRVIERALEVVLVVEPITMAGVQAMIMAIMVEQRDEMIQM